MKAYTERYTYRWNNEWIKQRQQDRWDIINGKGVMRDKPSYIYINRHGEVVEIRGTLTFNGACLGAAH